MPSTIVWASDIWARCTRSPQKGNNGNCVRTDSWSSSAFLPFRPAAGESPATIRYTSTSMPATYQSDSKKRRMRISAGIRWTAFVRGFCPVTAGSGAMSQDSDTNL
ncbi:unnamed protein product [Ranitomeya imitator]|uniref:Uncharacterized protein n=1 Tax=Ranitomeya imitator TaxID=111125 RepID=A0ABN9LEP2_9NEOB|nr:unnamed protein product [Ranitomeya imitator]